jgi:PilZ domain-containing protein/flagellar protein YcgR
MQFDDLKLLPGTRVKIMIAGSEGHSPAVTGKYVGCLRPHAVIVAVPASAVGSTLRSGAKVAGSLVTGTGIVNFISQVDNLNSVPFPHVFLVYPKTINMRNVRAAVRVDVDIAAQVANLDELDMLEMQSGQVIDLSVLGLKLGSSNPLGAVGDELAIHLRLAFEDIARDVTLIGKIRTLTETQLEAATSQSIFPFVLGVEFLPLDEDKRVLLHAYVFNRVQRYGAQI